MIVEKETRPFELHSQNGWKDGQRFYFIEFILFLKLLNDLTKLSKVQQSLNKFMAQARLTWFC